MTTGDSDKGAGTRHRNRWRHLLTGRMKWVLLIVLAAVIALRLALPFIVESYVNKTLDDIPGYRGHIHDIDINLWRGAYVIHGVNIEKTSGNIPVPFFSASQVDLSVEWSALFHASLVGEIEFLDPQINIVEGKTEEGSQNGEGADFIIAVKKLFPFKINRFDVNNGEVHFRNFHTDPQVDIHIDSLFLHASNLTNSKRLAKSLVASIVARGKIMNTGTLQGHLEIDPYALQPTFKVAIQLKSVELTRLNDFFDAYAAVDVESGVFQMYAELAAAEGRFTGYVKPLFRNMRVLDLERDGKNPLQLLWEALVAGVTELLTNQSEDQLGTRIPLSGTFDDPKADILSTIGGILKNAFIKALQPGFEHSITLKKLGYSKP
jgi:hypothetical protein